MDQPRPVIAVPVHRPEPSADESLALARCQAVLGRHPIRIVHPAGMDSSAYRRLLPAARPLEVPPGWMASYRAYNRMLVNPSFFRLFRGHSHLLIHEPDALVVSDRLIHWCQQECDYIGAPWFQGFSRSTADAALHGVGNSGFSLFRLQAVEALLHSGHRWYPYRALAAETRVMIRNRPLGQGLGAIKSMVTPLVMMAMGVRRILRCNCDLYWSKFAQLDDPCFRVSDPETAIRFAWEAHPRACLQRCGGELPFGLHAWARYDRAFVVEALALESGRSGPDQPG